MAVSFSNPSITGTVGIGLACPICDETKRAYLFVIRGLPVARCPGCGLVSLSPQPSLVDCGIFYGDSLAGQDPRVLWTDGKTERDAARQYLLALKERGLTEGRVLVLAPPGHPFVAEAKAEGLEVGLHVSIRDLEDGLDLGGPYDAAVVLYQLEKATDPLNVLRQVHAVLRPRGVLLLTSPSTDSWPSHFFGAQWTEWRPENRFYFGTATIQAILLKSGFAEVWVERERRLYTLRHIYDRAIAFPRTLLTRLIRLSYRFVPSPLRDARIRLTSSGMLITAVRAQSRTRPMCSIIVPVYNERNTFPVLMAGLLEKRLEGIDREIIVVESNSTDGTRELALEYETHPEVSVVLQERPNGKGNAVRTGLAKAQGDIVMIQDADLEYDLNDYDALLEPLLAYRSVFVLGVRHGGTWKMRKFSDQQGLADLLNLGHVFFTTLINVLYGQQMSDPFTMYKVFRRDCLYELEFECNRFDFDHELVIKLVRKGYRPLEVPVNYRSRSFREGKKVSMVRDPLSWVWVDLKYRFVPLRRRRVK